MSKVRKKSSKRGKAKVIQTKTLRKKTAKNKVISKSPVLEKELLKKLASLQEAAHKKFTTLTKHIKQLRNKFVKAVAGQKVQLKKQLEQAKRELEAAAKIKLKFAELKKQLQKFEKDWAKKQKKKPKPQTKKAKKRKARVKKEAHSPSSMQPNMGLETNKAPTPLFPSIENQTNHSL